MYSWNFRLWLFFLHWVTWTKIFVALCTMNQHPLHHPIDHERKRKKKNLPLVHWILIVHSVLTYSILYASEYIKKNEVGVLILTLFFFSFNINRKILINTSVIWKNTFFYRERPTFSFSLYIEVVCDIYIEKMSNLYSDGELCYLPMLIVFIFFIALFVSFQCCALSDLQQMHTYMLQNSVNVLSSWDYCTVSSRGRLRLFEVSYRSSS